MPNGTTLTLTMRPHDFTEVIGLETAINTVRAKIDSGEVPRGFLIKGEYGCGKTTLAWIIARYIQGPLFEGTPQVIEVNGANYRKIENMRELADVAGSYPMAGTYNVIIIDECHQLTKDAQQVLLKELEVPKSPTIWILATTDPEKMNSGVRDRCFPLTVEGMSAPARKLLVERAAGVVKHEGQLDEFLDAVTKAKLTSPRKILMAFEVYHNGTPAKEAVGNMLLAISPEYHDIGFAVCFGQWDKESSLFGGTVTVKPLGQQLKELDERLKKKPAPDAETSEKEDAIEEGDLDSKTEAARALRAVVGGFLKGQILPSIQKGGTFKHKEPVKAQRVYEAMHVLANAIPEGAYELQWSGLMTTLWRVNQKMQGK